MGWTKHRELRMGHKVCPEYHVVDIDNMVEDSLSCTEGLDVPENLEDATI